MDISNSRAHVLKCYILRPNCSSRCVLYILLCLRTLLVSLWFVILASLQDQAAVLIQFATARNP